MPDHTNDEIHEIKFEGKMFSQTIHNVVIT